MRNSNSNANAPYFFSHESDKWHQQQLNIDGNIYTCKSWELIVSGPEARAHTTKAIDIYIYLHPHNSQSNHIMYIRDSHASPRVSPKLSE